MLNLVQLNHFEKLKFENIKMDRLSLILKKDLIVEYLNRITRRHLAIAGGALLFLWASHKVKNWLSLKRYFKKMKIPGPSPKPVFGNFLDMVKEGVPYYELRIMKEYGRIVGFFEGSEPVILTTDVNFMKSIFIRDFNSFVNRRLIDAFDVPPINRFLSVLKDDDWKSARAILSTSFTTGKIKGMSKCMLVCANNFANHLEDVFKTGEPMDVRKAFGCYSLDVIASCCFGVDTNSIKDQDNDFIRNMKIILHNSLETNPKFLLIAFFPQLAGFLSQHNMMDFFPKKNFQMLSDFTMDLIKRRKERKDERRDDFIQNMIEHQESEGKQTKEADEDKDEQDAEQVKNKWNTYLKKTLTNTEIIAQAIIFLIAGFETTAINLGFIAYNLALHPEYQDKLCSEIDDVLEKHNDVVDYDSISEMKYMEAVINETLRMYPPAQHVERVVTQNIDYADFSLKKGQVIMVPVYALHHDPEYYPEPERFRPERFFDELEKKSRDNLVFMPFGAGPRVCLGNRFALIEIKILLATVLSKFRFERCSKTPEKVTLDSSTFSRALSPIYVKVVKR